MRRWIFAALPLLVGLVISVIAWIAGERRHIWIEFQFAWLWLLIGVLVTFFVAVVMITNQVQRTRTARNIAEGRRQQQDSHRTFLQRLDHELKNPVMGIRAALANVPTPTTAEGGAAVQSISQASERLTRIVTDLRKLSDLSSVALEVVPLQVDDLAREAIELVRESVGAEGRTITASFPRAPRPLPSIAADQDLVFLAITNIITNAVKYSEPGDTIEVRGMEDADGIVLDVADTGLGIAAEDLPHVWEELSRGRATMHVPGTGLGLPFVRAIVERHGGRVGLTSRLGEGTSVRMHLPRAPHR